jgi:hypothetical protein
MPRRAGEGPGKTFGIPRRSVSKIAEVDSPSVFPGTFPARRGLCKILWVKFSPLLREIKPPEAVKTHLGARDWRGAERSRREWNPGKPGFLRLEAPLYGAIEEQKMRPKEKNANSGGFILKLWPANCQLFQFVLSLIMS